MSAYIAPGEVPLLKEEGLLDIAESDDSECTLPPTQTQTTSTCHDIFVDYVCDERCFLLESYLSVITTLPPPEECQIRGARTTPSKHPTTVRSGLSKRVRGRLSELPTMPLDILYEVRYIS
jgi:hypothetical protein